MASGEWTRVRGRERIGRKGTLVSLRNSPRELFLFLLLAETLYSNIFLRVYNPGIWRHQNPHRLSLQRFMTTLRVSQVARW